MWAVRLAFTGYMTSTTSAAAEQLYQQAEHAFKNGDRDGAVQFWMQASQASPNSTTAENARNRIYDVSVDRARVCYDARDYTIAGDSCELVDHRETQAPGGVFLHGVSCVMHMGR